MALVPRSYDPTQQALSGPNTNKFVMPTGRTDSPPGFVWVTLTEKGNRALFELCHQADSKTVWAFPSYEFLVRIGSITVEQVKTARPSYVNAILIASRGQVEPGTCSNSPNGNFGQVVRVPGYWNGCCASCKWKDHANRCPRRIPGEAKFVPTSIASLPSNIIEELED